MRKTDSGFFISCGDDSRHVAPSEEHKGDRFFYKASVCRAAGGTEKAQMIFREWLAG